MSQLTVKEIARRCEGARKTNDGYRAKCPAHGGDNPESLHIWEENGTLRMHCHSQECSRADILKAIGITDNGTTRAPSDQIVHDYTDASGNLVFQVLRQGTGKAKKIRQRRPDPANPGEFIWNMQGVERVLYHLPAVVEAVKNGDTVLIVEGEKDVHTAESLGFVATTNPGGAGKWQRSYSECLKGAKVVIIPDADQPGRNHAAKVARLLQEHAASIVRVDLPGLEEHGDLTDWFNTGGTREELRDLIEATSAVLDPIPQSEGKRKKPVLIQASTVEPEEVTWLWYPLLPLGKLVIAEGDPGAGKTWLALEIAKIISKGEPFPNLAPEVKVPERNPGRVIYASAEDGVADTLVPRLQAAGADCERIYVLTGWCCEASEESGAVSLQDIDTLRQAMDEAKPELVVIDPLQAFLGEKVDINKANSVRGVLSPVVALAEEFQCTVLAIRHLTKGGRERALYRGLGSIDFTAAARSQLLVGFDPEDDDRRIVAHAKSSLAPKGPSLAFRLVENRIAWDGLSNLTAEDLCAPPTTDSESESSAIDEARDFLYTLLADGPVEAKEVKKQARQASISEITLKRAKAKMQIQSHRISEGNEGAGGWVWKLDEQGDQSRLKNDDPLEILAKPIENKGFIDLPQEDHMISLQEDYEANENNNFPQGGKGIIQDEPRDR